MLSDNVEPCAVDPENGYEWTITFVGAGVAGDVPLLQLDASIVFGDIISKNITEVQKVSSFE